MIQGVILWSLILMLLVVLYKNITIIWDKEMLDELIGDDFGSDSYDWKINIYLSEGNVSTLSPRWGHSYHLRLRTLYKNSSANKMSVFQPFGLLHLVSATIISMNRLRNSKIFLSQIMTTSLIRNQQNTAPFQKTDINTNFIIFRIEQKNPNRTRRVTVVPTQSLSPNSA